MFNLDSLIVFQNENWVVVDKPAMVLTTPSRFENEDDRMVMGRELEKKMQCQIFPVHRLDFEVSGLVIYAKNEKAHAAGNYWFENKLVNKTYRALSRHQDFSHIPENVKIKKEFFDPELQHQYEWRSRIFRGKKRSFDSPQGKPSLTYATCINMENGIYQWNLEPLTGRPHQLRYEMSKHGYSIIGDELYGSKFKFNSEGIALRAFQIELTEVPIEKRFGLLEQIKIDPIF